MFLGKKFSWVEKLFVGNFNFYTTLARNKCLINVKMIPLLYLEVLTGRSKYFFLNNSSHFLWFNKTTKVDAKYIYFEEVLINAIKFVGNLFESCGNVKPWDEIKEFHSLESKNGMELIYLLGTSWKRSIAKSKCGYASST